MQLSVLFLLGVLWSQLTVSANPARMGIADSAFMTYVTSSLTTLFPAYIRLNKQDPTPPLDFPVDISFSGVSATATNFSVIGLSKAKLAGVPAHVSLKEKKFSVVLTVLNLGLLGQTTEFRIENDYSASGSYEYNDRTYQVQGQGQTALYLEIPSLIYFVLEYSNISVSKLGRVDVSNANMDAYYSALSSTPAMPIEPWTSAISGLSAAGVQGEVGYQIKSRVEKVRQGMENPVAQLTHRFFSQLLLGTPSFSQLEKMDDHIDMAMTALNIPAEEISLKGHGKIPE